MSTKTIVSWLVSVYRSFDPAASAPNRPGNATDESERKWRPGIGYHPEADRRAWRELDALSANMRARFARIGRLIATVGMERIGAPHVRHLTGPLWEVRLSGRDGIARALYVTAAGRRVVVVRTFVKKTRRESASEGCRDAVRPAARALTPAARCNQDRTTQGGRKRRRRA